MCTMLAIIALASSLTAHGQVTIGSATAPSKGALLQLKNDGTYIAMAKQLLKV